MTITEQLRSAVKEHTTTCEPQRLVAAKCEVSPSVLSRFIAGKGGLSLSAVERLAGYLKLALGHVSNLSSYPPAPTSSLHRSQR